jgi:hypothetical protein
MHCLKASKAFKQANTTTTDYTVDIDAEKAKREVNKQIANLAEEKVPGTGNLMQVFLKNFSIREIWNCIRDFLIYIITICRDFLICIITICGNMLCCNMRKTEKQEVLTIPPPKEEGTKQVKQEKKTTRRGRAKSPRR